MLTKIKGDERTAEYRVWSHWLKSAAELQGEWHLADPEDNPFAYNETASVSFLCCAAGRAGYVGLADYRVEKFLGYGRCDLWLSDGAHEWAFEFKQLAPGGVPRRRIHRKWAEATRCAMDLRKESGIGRVAGLILSTYWIDDDDRRESCRTLMAAFVGSDADFAWELNPTDKSGVEATIAFKLID